jgi:hypothetical protein
MLKENKIQREHIYLVVHNKEQAEMYKVIPEEYYNKILITNKDEGHNGQMNWVFNKYKIGQKILKLDDDISSILKLENGKLVKTNTLAKIIDEGFKLCEENGFKLWGLYPSPNAYFMKGQEYTTDLRFIVGALMGIINEKIHFDTNIKIKGDYEYTIQSYLKNGGLIRFNKIAFKYDIAKNEGDRINTMIKDANILIDKYPDLVKHNARRNGKTPMGEILLNKQIKGGKLHNFDDESTKVIVDKIDVTEKLKDLQDRLLILLDNTYMPPLKKRKDNTSSRGDVIGYNGATLNLGIGFRRQLGVSGFSANKKNPELYKLVIEYGNTILPTGFKYTAITLNRNTKAKKHTDGGNAGVGGITFLGDYTGGGLFVYDENDKPTLYDTHNTLILFNGANLAHKTEPFKKTRYALIYYNQRYSDKVITGMEGR